MKKYSCAKCVNLDSPLCEYCTRREVPSGKEMKPSYWIGASSVITLSPIDKATEAIINRLLHRSSVPIQWVMTYNTLAEPKLEVTYDS